MPYINNLSHSVFAILMAMTLLTSISMGRAYADTAPPPCKQAQHTACLATMLSSAGQTTPDNVSGGEQDGFQITTGSMNKNATLNVSLNTGAQQVLNLGFGAPLDSTTNQAQLATLDGLPGTYNFSFNAKKLWSNYQDTLNSDCYAAYEAAVAAYTKQKKVAPTGFSDTVDDCADGDIAQIMKEAGIDPRHPLLEYQKYENEETQGPPLWAPFYGGSAAYGRNQYKYLDPATAAQQQTNMNSWSLSGYVGVIKPGVGVFTLSYSHQLTPKEGNTTVLCPKSISVPLKCASAALGAPQQTDKNIYSLGFRRQFTPNFAISPSINYDVVAKTMGVDFPIFLVSDSKSNLNGGIRLGWRNDTHAFTASIFVGSNFSYFDDDKQAAGK